MKILIFSITLLFGFQATANENPFREELAELSAFSSRIQSEVNPFESGTEIIVLTENEKKTLAEYAFTSKVLLERVLRKAQGKTLEEVHDLYVQAIKQVVIESFQDKKRSELLMRYALNQALQLTVGIPTADGKSISAIGVLANVQNKDVITSILEDSIRLAIRYYQDDIVAINTGSLVKLPYINFGNERLVMAQNWGNSIHQPELLLSFQVKVLEQWMSTVANQEVLDRLRVGEAILDVDAALNDIKSQSYSTQSKIRYLRGKIDDLFDTLRRLGFRVTERAVPALSSQSYALKVVIGLEEVDEPENLKLYDSTDMDMYVGQGYTGMYYYRYNNPNKHKTATGYNNFDEASFREFLETECKKFISEVSSVRTVCAPVQKIPRAYSYVSNEVFKESHTVPLILGTYIEKDGL